MQAASLCVGVLEEVRWNDGILAVLGFQTPQQSAFACREIPTRRCACRERFRRRGIQTDPELPCLYSPRSRHSRYITSICASHGVVVTVTHHRRKIRETT